MFQQSKAKFDEEYGGSLKKYTAVIEDNHKLLDTDQETMSLISQRKGDLYSAEDYLKVYDQYSKAYKDLKKLKK